MKATETILTKYPLPRIGDRYKGKTAKDDAIQALCIALEVRGKNKIFPFVQKK